MQNIYVATVLIPELLKDTNGGFLRNSSSPLASAPLIKFWDEYGRDHVPAHRRLSGDSLTVEGIRENDALCVIIRFPHGNAFGEFLFGMVVARPINLDLPNSDFASVPYRYFGMTSDGERTVLDLTDKSMRDLGPGPAPEITAFVEWVLNYAVRGIAGATIQVPKQDEEMNKAISQAKRTLPGVLASFLAGDLSDSNFTVKVPVADGKFTEHFWLSHTTVMEGVFTGVVDADPTIISNVKRGDRRSARMEEVTDWMYARDGKMHGNYTLRELRNCGRCLLRCLLRRCRYRDHHLFHRGSLAASYARTGTLAMKLRRMPSPTAWLFSG